MTSCVVASGVRLYYIAAYYQVKHPSPEIAESAIFHSFLWAIIEPCASILAASLPTYSPVVRKYEEEYGDGGRGGKECGEEGLEGVG
ncbi:GPCR family protein [Rutstroemia sp. NJR-2017a BBW]|nr:GPCR family protein [Rutstroemia sp. NJR-2017a BBW]